MVKEMKHVPYIAPSFLIGGKGVFAGQVYDRGDVIETCHVVPVSYNKGVLDDYRLAWSDDTDCVASGCAMFYNHSEDPNVELVRIPERWVIEVRALKRIFSCEELFIKYACGKWWE